MSHVCSEFKKVPVSHYPRSMHRTDLYVDDNIVFWSARFWHRVVGLNCVAFLVVAYKKETEMEEVGVLYASIILLVNDYRECLGLLSFFLSLYYCIQLQIMNKCVRITQV